MGYVLGMDEAGLGPNLGPFLLGISVWKVPGSPADFDWETALAKTVTTVPNWKGAPDRPLAITDSKKLYQTSRGVGLLERALWASFAQRDTWPTSWEECWKTLSPSSLPSPAFPWYAHYQERLPQILTLTEIQQVGKLWNDGLGNASLLLKKLEAQACFVSEWNEEIDRYKNKSIVLTQRSLQFLRGILEAEVLPSASQSAEEIEILCDKHGARNHYAAVLWEFFPDSPIQTLQESHACSTYRFLLEGCPVRISFRKSADSLLPVAYASIAAKYMRECAMKAINTFWQEKVPGLKATAGYPVDARRFLQEIEPIQRTLGIPLEWIWRVK
ncbi:Hypothetical protein PBC10988_41510 [Planctomycetales bacterium 10988]|nr:Hypothetical protein PBC10988_41510 [Planctomycetales bacterium 10988]